MSFDFAKFWPNEFFEKKIQLLYSSQPKFLGWWKPDTCCYTRSILRTPGISLGNPATNRLFICKNRALDKVDDIEFSLFSIKKLPFLREIAIECEIDNGFGLAIAYNSPEHIMDGVTPGVHRVERFGGTFLFEFNPSDKMMFTLTGKSSGIKDERYTFKILLDS